MKWFRRAPSPPPPPPFDGHVRRVHTFGGSHVVPPFDEGWDDRTQLIWYAAVASVDTGLPIQVGESHYSIRGVRQLGFYDVIIDRRSVSGPYSFNEAWTYLSGISAGVRAIDRMAEGA